MDSINRKDRKGYRLKAGQNIIGDENRESIIGGGYHNNGNINNGNVNNNMNKEMKY